ncbi:hypothetical protein [Streptomyces sp. NPDC017448]|uniref:hypothetical protein n=1 Tax=Streptomyces sp. NPDC017448 TaxID=3364996 RepID=UPI0037AA8FEB
MDDEGVPVRDRIVGRYKSGGELEVHLRQRQVAGLPDTLDISQFNTRAGAYRAGVFMPDDPRLIRALIKGLERHLEQAHGEGRAEDA